MKHDRSLGSDINNWVLLAAVGIVSFGGALIYAIVGENSIFIKAYFIAGSALVAGFSSWWFAKNPPAMISPAWQYYALIAFLMIGATITGGIENSRSIGAWITVGISFIIYGILERNRHISFTGLLSSGVAIALYVCNIPNLGIVLEIITGLIFLLSALLLKHSKQNN